MRKLLLTTVALLCFATSAVAFEVDGEEINCGNLWYTRNHIYARNGYCFHTGRGIRVFGNRGCMYENDADVPLSTHDRESINILVQAERYLQCH
jgi:hypothetical protein